jgi:tetratricopeptide (TPR) repeat protein
LKPSATQRIALTAATRLGDTAALALSGRLLAIARTGLGDYQQARVFCQQAIALCADVGHRWLEGPVWDSLGYIEHYLGNLAEAAACYERALSVYNR